VKHSTHLIAAALVTALAGQAHATVTPEEAAQLGTTLTETGAMKAGNQDGTIPPYDPAKALAQPVQPYKPVNPNGGFPYADPYASEKPLFSITAANMAEYAGRIDEGNKYLLTHDPGYRMDIYPTHRSAALPQWVLQNTVKFVQNPRLVGDGNGIENAHAQIPFPIPHEGKEAMWNAQLRYKAPFERADSYEAWLVDSSGSKSLIYKAMVDYEHQYWNPDQASPEYFWRLVNYLSAPAAKAGSRDIRVLPLRLDISESNAWSYTQGQRRVRLAPEFKYDTVNAQENGVKLYDEIAGFDGKMDRFDFKLLGRKEMYILYNSYKAQEAPVDHVLGEHFINPDLQRWELHRVWTVEATLKPGARHIYSKRYYYLDEDSWNYALYDAFDQAGHLYRSSAFFLYVAQETPAVRCDAQVFYDHVKGAYSLSGWVEPGLTGWHKHEPFSPNYFSPETLAGSGWR
jgi:hypothetical protein